MALMFSLTQFAAATTFDLMTSRPDTFGAKICYQSYKKILLIIFFCYKLVRLALV
jgi:hypothetical protein